MLVGYGENDNINANIIISNEEVNYQFWYPGMNKVIKEHTYIKDSYSWDDEFESESEVTQSTNSPKIYDLRTPQKKSRKTEMYSEVTSGKLFNVLKDDDTQDRRTWNSKQSKPTPSTKLVSKPASKHTAVSLVDMILLEEFSRDKHSKIGTITKPKRLQKTLIPDDLLQG